MDKISKTYRWNIYTLKNIPIIKQYHLLSNDKLLYEVLYRKYQSIQCYFSSIFNCLSDKQQVRDMYGWGTA